VIAPSDDHACLSAITDAVRDRVQQDDPAIREIASRFSSTERLIAWIRSPAQRDDANEAGGVP
jgi:hypothetical protein